MPEEVIPSTDAIRFTYGLDAGGAFGLIDAVAVSVTALPSGDLDPDLAPFGGFWYELRDLNGAVLWRHVTQHPLRATVEVYGDGDVGLLDDDVGDPVATIAVPSLDGASTVALMGTQPGDPGGEAVELLVHGFEALVA